MSNKKPGVGIIMGSQSDWPTLKAAADVLDELRVPYETTIVSAHRTPEAPLRLSPRAQGARLEGDHRRRRRRGAPARHDRIDDRRCRCSACPSRARRCQVRTACSPSCRCRPAFRSARSPSAKPAPPMPALLAAQILALATRRSQPASTPCARSADRRRRRGTERTMPDAPLPPGSDDRHPGRRPARPHAGAGRRAARPEDATSIPTSRRARLRRRAHGTTIGSLRRRGRARRLCRGVDVVTYEFENVPAARSQLAGASAPVLSGAKALRRRAGPSRSRRSSCAASASRSRRSPTCDDRSDLRAALSRIVQLPAILKTRRFGYDGKGQARDPRRDGGRSRRCKRIGGAPAVLERPACPSSARFGDRRARPRRRDAASTMPVENVHQNGILATSARAGPASATMCADAAREIAGEDRRGARLCRRARRSRCSTCEDARPRAARRQRDRAAGAQLRPLDHRRLRSSASSRTTSAPSPAGRSAPPTATATR